MMRRTITLFVLSLSLLLVSALSIRKPSQQSADSWTWPLGSDGYVYTVRHNTKPAFDASKFPLYRLDFITK